MQGRCRPKRAGRRCWPSPTMGSREERRGERKSKRAQRVHRAQQSPPCPAEPAEPAEPTPYLLHTATGEAKRSRGSRRAESTKVSGEERPSRVCRWQPVLVAARQRLATHTGEVAREDLLGCHNTKNRSKSHPFEIERWDTSEPTPIPCGRSLSAETSPSSPPVGAGRRRRWEAGQGDEGKEKQVCIHVRTHRAHRFHQAHRAQRAQRAQRVALGAVARVNQVISIFIA